MGFAYTDTLLTIGATEFETVVSFYCQLLEQEPQVYLPAVYAEFDLKRLRLGIFKPKESHKAEFSCSVNSGMSLCLEVEDLEAAINHLIKIGYSPTTEINIASHGREIYTFDPAENRIILYQGTGNKQ